MLLKVHQLPDPLLKKPALDVRPDDPHIQDLIDQMLATMDHHARCVGLAAPQVGKSIRLFVVDGTPFAEEDEHPELRNFRKVFINAKIVEEKGEEWTYNEGCLSIPKIREDVKRRPAIRIRYRDEKFIEHEEVFTGITARIIEHEYDHIEGKLFIDRINPLRRTLLKSRLADIAKGRVEADYKMKFPLKK